MSIKYSIDKTSFHQLDDRSVLYMQGWVLDTETGEVPALSLKINDVPVPYRVIEIDRPDVIKVVKGAKDGHKYGFRIQLNHLPLNIDSIRLQARTLKEKKLLLIWNHYEVKRRAKSNPYLYDIDAVSFQKSNSVFSIAGWCVSLYGEGIDIAIQDENGREVDSHCRWLSRSDIYYYQLIDQPNRKCGFHIQFEGYRKDRYFLILKSSHGEEKIDLQLHQRRHSSQIRKVAHFIRSINKDLIKETIEDSKEYGWEQSLKWMYTSTQPEWAYNNWFERRRVTKEELEKQRETVFSYSPVISIVVPTYNTPKKLLIQMIESVRKQSYGRWELCIADGSDFNSAARRIVLDYQNKDPRIKVRLLEKNYGISGNTNKALEMASGSYIGLFDHDDVLELDALYEVVKSLQKKRHDIVYTDEDKLDNKSGIYMDPNFKPDWSPDLFNSHNYITHFFVVKTDIIKEVGGFRSEYDGSQDYDVMFRCIEKAKDIYHLPKVLYHWRMVEGSTALDPESKMYCYQAGQRAIEAHLERVGIKGTVTMLPKPYYGLYHVKYDVSENHPLVSILIPNYEHSDILKTCIDSLYQVNEYNNFEIIVIENNSKEQSTFEYYEQIQKEHTNIRVVKWEGKEFNFSAINNFGAKYAEGKYLLLLNNDTEMIRPDALSEMVGVLNRQDVGVVGAKLLYEDNTIQHAGVVIGFSGYAGHVFNGIEEDLPGYMMRAQINCDYSAVTGACLLTKKELWDAVGGLDEQFKVACNDIDYCLKIRDLNKLVVYDAFSLWHHYESKSRGYEDTPEKKERFNHEVAKWQKKWGKYLPNNDPYYNPNFDITAGPYIVR